MRKISEECGVFGIWSPERKPLPFMAYYALLALQHRGQEASGIALNDDGIIRYHKGLGMVDRVFNREELEKRTGIKFKKGLFR